MAAQKASKPRSKIWKWTKRILIGIVIFAALLVFVGFPTLMAYFITHSSTRPFELKITDTPATFDTQFEDVSFPSFNSVIDFKSFTDNGRVISVNEETPMISGWYLPNDTAKAIVIYSHGLFRSRQEMLARACDLWKRGYAGLIIDFRRHGKSTGKLTSMGYLERLDVIAAVNYVKHELKLDLPVVVCSVSMGAAATLLAAAESPDIDIIIAESSFLSFKNTIVHHTKLLLGLPRFPIADTIMLLAKLWVGFSDDDFDLRLAVREINDRPILFLADEKDRRMPLEVEEQLFQTCTSTKKEFKIIPEATHGAAYRTNPELYVETVDDFLKKHLSPR